LSPLVAQTTDESQQTRREASASPRPPRDRRVPALTRPWASRQSPGGQPRAQLLHPQRRLHAIGRTAGV